MVVSEIETRIKFSQVSIQMAWIEKLNIVAGGRITTAVQVILGTLKAGIQLALNKMNPAHFEELIQPILSHPRTIALYF